MELISDRCSILLSVIILQCFIYQVRCFDEVVTNNEPSVTIHSSESEIDKSSDPLSSSSSSFIHHPASEYEGEDLSTKQFTENRDVDVSDNLNVDLQVPESNLGNENAKKEETVSNNEPTTGNGDDSVNSNGGREKNEDTLSREILKAFDFTKYKIIDSPEKEEDDKKKGASQISSPEDNSNSVDENKDEKAEENVEGEEDEDAVSSKKPRYFPLLYSVGSLFSSFLAEFGETPSTPRVSSQNLSDSEMQNSTAEEKLLLMYDNATKNATDQKKKTRFQCSLSSDNLTEINETSQVKIINSTELMEMLNFSKNQKSSSSPCVVVMFYTKWCHFSARAAPEYNALARAFPQLDILAVDTSHFSYLNAKFGTVAVPNIMLFHSRSAVRFNHTTRSLEYFKQFIFNNTGLEPTTSVYVLPEDFEGPLSSKVEEGRDWLLWLSWIFILVCSIYAFFFSLYGQSIIARITVLWQEHQHIE